ncbi:hypothetical protein XBFFL1_1640052 [Xenorhabdus bovienii str. feltiae Florida]|uniref:Uncharacterized protein n=1 Tax=Xenorhabdus bovienii str. feltiae Moldova TaxID=1398200 RepID=A0A077NLT4_XENBV|nr:hypothetical protein XBFFR1_1990028 [Xenorhabdus bovienii str. feltiae France]CDG91540.1 hypothetical protein XBFFL1_1640052 [Xenorhabdus bovienii str. feltiae Florida]CDG99800.1 hypothetical protein XBFM1_120007 [Xenorhabdus bovienii str. feltiae Moldova]
MPIITSIPRNERRLMQKTIQKTRDKNHARRLIAILMLYRGDTVSYVVRSRAVVLLSFSGLTGIP